MTLGNENAYPFTPNQQMKLDDGTWDQNTDYGEPGFTKLEHACIDLRIPASGDAELDALIAQAQRRDAAVKAMQGMYAATRRNNKDGSMSWPNEAACAALSRTQADALLAELAKEPT